MCQADVQQFSYLMYKHVLFGIIWAEMHVNVIQNHEDKCNNH